MKYHAEIPKNVLWNTLPQIFLQQLKSLESLVSDYKKNNYLFKFSKKIQSISYVISLVDFSLMFDYLDIESRRKMQRSFRCRWSGSRLAYSGKPATNCCGRLRWEKHLLSGVEPCSLCWAWIYFEARWRTRPTHQPRLALTAATEFPS